MKYRNTDKIDELTMLIGETKAVIEALSEGEQFMHLCQDDLANALYLVSRQLERMRIAARAL